MCLLVLFFLYYDETFVKLSEIGCSCTLRNSDISFNLFCCSFPFIFIFYPVAQNLSLGDRVLRFLCCIRIMRVSLCRGGEPARVAQLRITGNTLRLTLSYTTSVPIFAVAYSILVLFTCRQVAETAVKHGNMLLREFSVTRKIRNGMVRWLERERPLRLCAF